MKMVSEIAMRLARGMYIVAGIALASGMFLTVADVVLRTFKRPIVGTYELVGFMVAVSIGLAIPETSRAKGHVLMDFVIFRLPSMLRRMLSGFTRFLGIVIFALITWNLWGLGDDLRKAGEVSPTLQLPFYPIAYAIAISCLIECLVLVVEILEWKDAQE